MAFNILHTCKTDANEWTPISSNVKLESWIGIFKKISGTFFLFQTKSHMDSCYITKQLKVKLVGPDMVSCQGTRNQEICHSLGPPCSGPGPSGALDNTLKTMGLDNFWVWQKSSKILIWGTQKTLQMSKQSSFCSLFYGMRAWCTINIKL